MSKFLLLALILPFVAKASQKVGFSCEPISDEVSFRIKGHFYTNAQGKYIGMAHSYAVFNEFESIKDCDTPWYEKFPLSGSTNSDFMLHQREYVAGCMQHFKIPLTSSFGYMWVSKKEEPGYKSKLIKANCRLDAIEQ